MLRNIWDFTKSELDDLMVELQQPAFRSKQIYEWLYVHNARSFEEMSNLPKALRAQLAESYSIDTPRIVETKTSEDGTNKYLIELLDGEIVETVAIPSYADDRLTICLSSQVGCPMQCAFCATGKEGYGRNLSQSEMVFQVLLAQEDFGSRVSNVVVMGQGEPFLNYVSLMNALHILNDPKGIGIGARHITVSSCGICSSIRKFAGEREQFTLAISLHAARQEMRDILMPRCADQPIPELRSALLDYLELKDRRITFEYLMIEGVNDTKKDLEALMDFCKGILCHINFIPFNAIEGSPFQPSPRSTMNAWVDACNINGIEATIRFSKGSDIAGACGQLKARRVLS